MIEFAGLSKIHHETGKVNVRDFTGKVDVNDFFVPKMVCSPKWPRQSYEDMWNPLCFHGTGLHLPTRRRRWQSAQGNSIMEPQETLAQLFQLAIASGSGPRGSTSPFGYCDVILCFPRLVILSFWHYLVALALAPLFPEN